MDKPSWDKLKWELIQKHLKYSNDELGLFKCNPRNEAVLDRGRDFQDQRIIIEAVESKDRNSQHQVSDKFILDGAGNLLIKHNPEILSGCFDVGVRCGGWGKVVIELAMAEKAL